MPHSLGPLRPDEIEALGDFLARGFRVSRDHPFAAPDVLAWKYGGAAGSPFRSLVARDERGAIAGHVGYALTTLCLARGGSGIERRSILHMLDWLSGRDHPGIGTELARAAHEAAEMAYGLGGTPASRRAVRRLDYALRGDLTVWRRVLRPLSVLRGSEALGRRIARAGRDVARGFVDRPARPKMAVEARRVDRFGVEVESLFEKALSRGEPLAATERTAALLDHRLAYPRGGQTGWHLMPSGVSEPIGFATTAISDDRVRTGTIVDLVLEDWHAELAHAAILALTEALRTMGADAARIFASPSFLGGPLHDAGYRLAHTIPWYLRDPAGAWPTSGPPEWFTFHEVDYAVLPV